jgi:hypothetical protein
MSFFKFVPKYVVRFSSWCLQVHIRGGSPDPNPIFRVAAPCTYRRRPALTKKRKKKLFKKKKNTDAFNPSQNAII